ncbi:ArnT family glycosyltransferase [Methylobacterium thuringiense]|uniref:Undecaprenyl phosphate-alpha-4-amino-4-deoxy-L-arabinose arabinosyl transferase n=1 Tax=Methylobacterium thuringiense TaxID=1003091 RepID=A0ABQ4TP62_9HYPH|nr:glycosyltransferase family 39 protein [Methylobacterium thuringiense]GJE55897.1 Undecaprenyl phosphate-alpha-4-amino-4-deoxy-L-arabinose arabinosyl transferase [Methylobacterium thuringiense]
MASLTAGSAAPVSSPRSSATRLAGLLAAALHRADRALGFAAEGHLRACALLLALALVCFLPGFVSLQPMDRDEPRFAQASKQMLETGDLVDIRFQGEARHKKPVGIYWAQAATVAAGEALGVEKARTTIALYRLPSLIGALAASLLAYWAALAVLPRRGAVLAAALFTACLMLSAEARLAKTDALLTACAVAAMGALARAWLGRVRLERERAPPSRGTALVFWLAVALGILVKGPMVPLFAGLAALVLAIRERSWRWLLALRPVPGLVLTLAIVAPWFLAIAWKSGGAFFGEAVGHDMLAKVGTGAEKHWAPPGSYLVVFFATFWPGAAFAALSLPFAWRHRRDDSVAFLLAWIVPAWALFEAVPTKLPHYVLPLMPAVAILTVLALARGPVLRRRWETVAAWLVVAVPLGVTIGVVAIGWQLDQTIPWLALPPLLAACALAGLSWPAFARGLGEGALALGVGAGALLSVGAFGLAQPEVPALKISPRLAAIRDALPCKTVQTASLGYREPSLVFLIGTDLATPNTGAEAVAFLRAGGCRLVFVEGRHAQDFASAAAGLEAARVGTVAGFNINTGRRTELSAYATGLAGAPAP